MLKLIIGAVLGALGMHLVMRPSAKSGGDADPAPPIVKGPDAAELG